jgi:hypothetical protein
VVTLVGLHPPDDVLRAGRLDERTQDVRRPAVGVVELRVSGFTT